MKYIEQVFTFKYDFWRYLVGSFIIIIASQIMQVPFVLAIIYKEGFGALASGDSSKLLGVLEPNLNLFLLLLPFAVCLPLLFFIVKKLHGQSVKALTTARKNIDWKRIFFSFFLWAGITTVLVLIDVKLSPESYVWNFKLVPFLILFFIGIIMVPIQTSLEEYIFRGYLMQGFGALFLNKWAPLLLTSLIFGGLHAFNPEVYKLGYGIMVYYIGTGLFLGILTLMDDGLELSLGFHAANNLITALLVTADWTAFQTHSIYKDVSTPALGWDVFMPVFVVFPILLLIFSKVYNWNNWMERLTGTIEKPIIVDKISETNAP
ncbi:CPBP family intramembrane metalloprotease [Galbibacter sp. BG1]|uniref:CPBP family intramembrane glutamic endopeptidase n=1 Tax=Galbibacter sp. BG1 TaxID=1170699 RepID=UPI0015C0DA4B|nr:CPBP family intramembrane glutamic endopeptidase [Galbibacter sp. BG1]QLE02936.1 CPBP family intramembrane metalloprotease [Galbibacter sp. BG1]